MPLIPMTEEEFSKMYTEMSQACRFLEVQGLYAYSNSINKACRILINEKVKDAIVN